MINISGELYIGLPIHNSGMAELQDAINEYTITNQLKYSKYDHKDNKNYPEPNVLRLYEKPLTQIYNEKDGEGFAKYIASVLDKLFPHPKLDDEVGPDKKYRLYDIFDFGGRDTRPYEYASDYRPSNYWEDESNKCTLDFNVTNYDEVKDYLVAKITFNFTTAQDISTGNVMRPITFIKEIFYALDESPFFENLTFGTGNSTTTYFDDSNYNGTYFNQADNGTYKLIDFHLVEKTDNLNEKLNNLVPLSQEDISQGTLITIAEAESNSFMNYDGYGYLCKEIDSQMYKSFISPDMDYVLPKLYKDNFTHMLWFNR
jgi:hypothetical protein